MNQLRLIKLLAATLAAQREPPVMLPKETVLDEKGIWDVLAGKRHWHDAERHALLRSPAARHQLYFLADVARAERYVHWKQAGIDSALRYQAAASGSIEPVTIDSNPHFILTLFPLDERGETWHLHLKLSEQARKCTATGIHLIDDQGDVWMAGQPDADGELSNDWQRGQSPLELLRERRLRLQPS